MRRNKKIERNNLFLNKQFKKILNILDTNKTFCIIIANNRF